MLHSPPMAPQGNISNPTIPPLPVGTPSSNSKATPAFRQVVLPKPVPTADILLRTPKPRPITTRTASNSPRPRNTTPPRPLSSHTVPTPPSHPARRTHRTQALRISPRHRLKVATILLSTADRSATTTVSRRPKMGAEVSAAPHRTHMAMVPRRNTADKQWIIINRGRITNRKDKVATETHTRTRRRAPGHTRTGASQGMVGTPEAHRGVRRVVPQTVRGVWGVR